MLNKVILIGNVGADPEVRSLEGGVKVARIRVATTERSYNSQTQEVKEFTEWHSVTLWRRQADFADRFVRKGSQVYIEGSIRSREWSDEAGNKRFGIEIVANDIKTLGRRPQDADQQNGQTSAQGGYTSSSRPQAAPPQEPLDDPDDLPF